MQSCLQKNEKKIHEKWECGSQVGLGFCIHSEVTFLHMRTVQVENAATYVFEHITLCPLLCSLFPPQEKITHQKYKSNGSLR